jgi:chromate transporter
MKRTPKLYLKLFLSTLQLSAFTFGGGYVIISFMQKKFVEKFGWISKEEMLDIVAISQSSPGAIAINASILIGYRIGGVLGALCTLFGTILPPLVVISAISFFYEAFKNIGVVEAALKAMQAGIAAVVVDVIYKLSKGYFKDKDFVSLALMAVAFSLAVFLNINVIFIILGAILFGIGWYFFDKRKAKKKGGTEE